MRDRKDDNIAHARRDLLADQLLAHVKDTIIEATHHTEESLRSLTSFSWSRPSPRSQSQIASPTVV